MKIEAVGCALAGLGLLLGPTLANGEEIHWGTSYRDGKDLAKDTGRLMMIDFWAEW